MAVFFVANVASYTETRSGKQIFIEDLRENGDWSYSQSLRDRWLRSSQPPPIIKGIIFYV